MSSILVLSRNIAFKEYVRRPFLAISRKYTNTIGPVYNMHMQISIDNNCQLTRQNFSSKSGSIKTDASAKNVDFNEDALIVKIAKKIPFFNIQKHRMNIVGLLLFESIADRIPYAAFMDEFSLPDTFYSWFCITELHVWMMSVRCMSAGEDGQLARNRLIEAMWSDVGQRVKKLGAGNSPLIRKQVKELSEQFQAALIGYDEGLLADDVTLAGALWRRLYQMRAVDLDHLDTLIVYIRRQDLDIEELDSMLLEELLGISKKRLKKIFEGQNNDDESSSESEEDIDIISLDDITDDDDIGIVDVADNDNSRNVNNKRHKHKKHRPKRIKAEIEIKKEKDTSSSGTVKKLTIERKKNSEDGENEKLLSVLELLELQARARAIKSQLLIEAENKQKAALEKELNSDKNPTINKETDNSSNASSEDDAIIIDIPKEEEIVIPSSDSEPDEIRKQIDPNIIDLDKEDVQTQAKPKFRIIRNRVIKPSLHLDSLTITVSNEKAKTIEKTANKEEEKRKSPAKETVKEESLANVSEFIGPIEMIHLDTLDVDLRDIILPEKEEEEASGDYLNDVVTNKKHFGDDKIDISSKQIEIESDKGANSSDIHETEEGEINDDKEDSDSDDVLQLDTVIDD